MSEKLLFKKKEADETMVDPKWTEVGAENTRCPRCKTDSLVVMLTPGFLYAWCSRCKRYFVGE